MQMHPVHLERSHRIQLLFQEINAAEMPGHIHMQPPIAKTRAVVYLAAAYLIDLSVSRHHVQCLHGIKESGLRKRLDSDSLRGDFH